MFNPMTPGQRKAACLAVVAFGIAFTGISSEAIPMMVTFAAFTIGTVFWGKAMFSK